MAGKAYCREFKVMRKRKFRLVYVIIVIAVFAAAFAVLSFCKDSVVISNGIVFFRAVKRTVLALGGALSAAAVIIYITESVFLLKAKKNYVTAQEEIKVQQEKDLYNEKKSRENLSVSRDMDSVQLRRILSSYGAAQWSVLSGQLRQICVQLDMMDEQQAKLAHLIENNGADALSNTQDLLDKVEQYLCKSVRKIINYMDVADSGNPADVSRVQEKVYECHSDLQQQLVQVQEFLFAFADFLNTQGDDDSSMDMLDIYKTTILDSIKD